MSELEARRNEWPRSLEPSSVRYSARGNWVRDYRAPAHTSARLLSHNWRHLPSRQLIFSQVQAGLQFASELFCSGAGNQKEADPPRDIRLEWVTAAERKRDTMARAEKKRKRVEKYCVRALKNEKNGARWISHVMLSGCFFFSMWRLEASQGTVHQLGSHPVTPSLSPPEGCVALCLCTRVSWSLYLFSI